ncbi:hypothetical protein SAMN06295885_3284 [Rathayibacter oskolensis]|uniref:Uncharacterized protein n=1 Tax=Rathayibacter oskolensis TaxID=1891671 RepID=A0A1X7PER4_9MICO|nr:hypothetical protein [Rathayibacter oskolensis]SMH49345.1 hypothetical protein SAMN06295885_3284 [Rathayibacter oskolensis]
MLDLVYVIGILAVFALVGVIAKGVEKLAPKPRGTSGSRAAISEDIMGPRPGGSGLRAAKVGGGRG